MKKIIALLLTLFVSNSIWSQIITETVSYAFDECIEKCTGMAKSRY